MIIIMCFPSGLTNAERPVITVFLFQVLENRTKASHKEMAQIDELEELREINARHAKVDMDSLIKKQQLYEEHLQKLQEEEEDKIIL